MSGFKKTEIGLVPDSWKVVTVSDVCEPPQYGFTDTSSKQGNAKYLRITDIKDFGVNWDAVPYCNCLDLNKHLLEENDIVIARIGATTGKSYIIKNPPISVFASYLIRLRKKPDLNADYLFYFCNSSIYWHQINASKGNNLKKGISGSVLKTVKLPYPPLEEQRNIAHILSKIQSAIEAQEKIIQTTTELKKALMQKLFTEGLKGEPQKETEIGLVPKGWEVVKVDDLGGIVTGTTPSTKKKEYYENGRFQFISPVDLGETKYVNRTEKEISSEGLKVSRVLPKDTVLVVCIGSTTGKVGLTSQEKSTTNQQINAIICNGNFNPHFIYYILDFKKNYIRSLATPSPVPILTKGQFQKAVIPITKNKQEQAAIAKVLSVIDEKTEQASRKKQTLQSLFKSMLHHLMTGQIRVKNLKFS